MSEQSSFAAALEPRAATEASGRGRSISPGRVRLRSDVEISRPVDVVRLLTGYGTPLKKAHAALETMAQGLSATVEIDEAYIRELVTELPRLGVQAQIMKIPDVTVRDVRTRLGLSQSDFALRFGLEKDTVQNWEQGRNRLDAATRMLLAVIEQCPEVVDAVLTAPD